MAIADERHAELLHRRRRACIYCHVICINCCGFGSPWDAGVFGVERSSSRLAAAISLSRRTHRPNRDHAGGSELLPRITLRLMVAAGEGAAWSSSDGKQQQSESDEKSTHPMHRSDQQGRRSGLRGTVAPKQRETTCERGCTGANGSVSMHG